MFYIMLRSRVWCSSWVCRKMIRLMNCRPIFQENYCGITNLDPLYVNQRNTSSDQKFYYRPRQQSSVSSTYLPDFKAYYSSKPTNIVETKQINKESDNLKPKKPKKEVKTYITLLGVDDSISVTTVEAAKKLADRRNFKLMKVADFDPKTSRAVFKLMTDLQYLKEDWDDSKSSNEKSTKNEKLVSLGSNCNENDVLTKLRMIKKWLAKKNEVRIVISGDITAGENVYKIMEKELGSDGRIVQKRAKNGSIRFQILPPKKSEENVPKQTDKE